MTKRHHTQKNIKEKASNLSNSTIFYSWTIILKNPIFPRVYSTGQKHEPFDKYFKF